MSERTEDYLLKLWILLAATAGAVTGAVIDKGLTLQGKVTAFFIGLSTAVFVGPLIMARFFPSTTLTPEAAGFFYIFAAVSNSAVPPFVRFVSKRAGDPLAFIRPKGDA
jgi:tellurite resistance protein TehA-like permease